MESYEIQHDCEDEMSPIFGISDTDYGAKNYAKFLISNLPEVTNVWIKLVRRNIMWNTIVGV